MKRRLRTSYYPLATALQRPVDNFGEQALPYGETCAMCPTRHPLPEGDGPAGVEMTLGVGALVMIGGRWRPLTLASGGDAVGIFRRWATSRR